MSAVDRGFKRTFATDVGLYWASECSTAKRERNGPVDRLSSQSGSIALTDADTVSSNPSSLGPLGSPVLWDYCLLWTLGAGLLGLFGPNGR